MLPPPPQATAAVGRRNTCPGFRGVLCDPLSVISLLISDSLPPSLPPLSTCLRSHFTYCSSLDCIMNKLGARNYRKRKSGIGSGALLPSFPLEVIVIIFGFGVCDSFAELGSAVPQLFPERKPQWHCKSQSVSV